jgi:hypothetical protein
MNRGELLFFLQRTHFIDRLGKKVLRLAQVCDQNALEVKAEHPFTD